MLDLSHLLIILLELFLSILAYQPHIGYDAQTSGLNFKNYF